MRMEAYDSKDIGLEADESETILDPMGAVSSDEILKEILAGNAGVIPDGMSPELFVQLNNGEATLSPE